MARWQSGYAAACKAVYRSSILLLASILIARGVQGCTSVARARDSERDRKVQRMARQE